MTKMIGAAERCHSEYIPCVHLTYSRHSMMLMTVSQEYSSRSKEIQQGSTI